MSILDLVAVGVVAVVLLLPTPSKRLHPLYPPEVKDVIPELTRSQGDLGLWPTDAETLLRFVTFLDDAGQSDWSLRFAGAAAARPGPEAWRMMLVVASAHSDRLDVKDAHAWAQKALVACDDPASACADHERLRIALYEKALKAGLDSGIDPRLDPRGFARAVEGATPMIRVKVGPK
jgi:hypothetical protein